MNDKKQKLTQDQMDEALNSDLSRDFVTIGIDDDSIREVKIKIMNARKEPIFIREIKDAVKVDGDLSTQQLITILDELPIEKIAVAAAYVVKNSGEDDIDADWLLDHATTVQIIDLIKAQVEKQGYLDFLFGMMAALKTGKAR
jgi:hypothetical protein